MLSANPLSTRLKTTVFVLAMIAAFGFQLSAQEAPAVHAGYTRITGLPDDWTHHHLVFTNPGTEQEAIKNGTHEQWLKIVNDPRYVMNALKRNRSVEGPAAEDVKARYKEAAEDREIHDKFDGEPRERRRHRGPNQNPINSTIHRDWSMSLGSGGHLAAGQYPAKYNFSVSAASASCNDYAVFPTGLTGSASQATIVGYNNLYETTCGTSGTLPKIAWAYWTQTGGAGTGGSSNLSPVASYNGDQVAYIQTVASVAALVLVKVSAASGGTIGSPAAITYNSNATYHACAAPCYTTITLNGNPNDTNSAPFYDYASDVMYVGDNSGVLHKFQNVFNNTGTPAEITGGGLGSGWPQTMAAGVTLTSPVFDANSGNVFVGSSGGFLYRIPSTGGSSNLVASARLAAGTGIVDAPLIDSTPGTPVVYVFVGDDNAGSIHSAVYQLATNFGSGNAGTKESMGASTGSAGLTVYDGDFDNTHYSGSGTTGNLYFCGGTGTAPTTPTLYRIPINGAFNGTVAAAATPTGAAATCSPVTEFQNTGSGGGAVTTLGTTSLASTTLNGSITAGAFGATLTSNTGIATGEYLLIDNELMNVTAGPFGNFWTVTRGQLGTTGAAHSNGATVTAYSISTTTTTLNGTITAGATTLVVASSTGIGIGDYILINAENMLVTNVAGTTLTVTRGALGSAAAGHTNGATVTIDENTLPAATTTVNVVSGTSIGTGDFIQVGTEFMQVTAGGGTTSLTVARGALGTTAASQVTGANVLVPTLDWAYLSVSANGNDTGCTGACVYNYYITGAITGATATTGLTAAGGASGIIIDNSTTTAGESQIYFTTLANQACVGNGTTGNTTGGCAVQVSQSGLN